MSEAAVIKYYDVLPFYPVFACEALLHVHADRPVVLKTDCWNEAYGRDPVIPALPKNCRVHCIEKNPESIKVAVTKNQTLAIQEGDIRDIPFPDQYFDAVLDLSTIDHIPDYQKALDEYHRVLKPGGIALIIVWLDDQAWYQYQEKYDVHVWYAAAADFMSEFQKRFEIQIHHKLPGARGADGMLTKFIGKKLK